MRKTLVSLVAATLFLTASGCGCGGGGDLLNETDEKLAGQWVSEKLGFDGDRVLLTIVPGEGQRYVELLAIRPTGETVPVTNGNYSLHEDDGQITFNLSGLSELTSPFTVDDEKLTIGTEIYHRLNSPLTGPQIGGQIQVSGAVADESVQVNSASVSEILVKYKDGRRELISVQAPAAEAAGLTDSILQRSHERDASVEEAGRRLEELNTDPDVEYAVPNRIVRLHSLASPTDSFFDEQWNLDVLNITDVWGIAQSPTEVVVAVIDTGIVLGHPDLPAGRVLFSHGYDFVHLKIDGVPNLSLDGDGPDDNPTDPGDRNNMGLPGGSSYHGTHVTGLIVAATDNGVGISGISLSAKILPLRAMGNGGSGTLDDVAQAIYYAAKLPNIAECSPFTVLENGGYSFNPVTWTCNIDPTRPRAHIINLSLGEAMTAFEASPLTEAIDAATAAGVVVVASAGNEHMGPGFCRNATGSGFHADSSCNFYPAAHPKVLSVGAVYPNLSFAQSYSNFGNTQFLVAPGGSNMSGILSTVHPAVSGGYGELVGTSQAAAHVSAVAAILLAENPALGAEGVKQKLQSSALDLGTAGKDDQFGWGMVNPCGAVMAAKNITPTGASTLQVSSESVDFGSFGDSHTVLVTSGCGGSPITGITMTKTTSTGGNWLNPFMSASTTPAKLVVSVNRTGLAPGTYQGTVTVSSTRGTASISVSLTVGNTSLTGGEETDNLRQQIEDFLSNPAGGSADESDFENETDIGEVIVLLVDATTNQVKYFTRTDFSANYRFQFGGITAGRYYVLAGIDENQDGKICVQGEDEGCFAFPNYTNPELVEVTDTSHRNDLVLTF